MGRSFRGVKKEISTRGKGAYLEFYGRGRGREGERERERGCGSALGRVNGGSGNVESVGEGVSRMREIKRVGVTGRVSM